MMSTYTLHFPDGAEVNIDELHFDENIFDDIETVNSIKIPSDINLTFKVDITGYNKKAFKKFFKLPRKLKKKIYGTRSKMRKLKLL